MRNSNCSTTKPQQRRSTLCPQMKEICLDVTGADKEPKVFYLLIKLSFFAQLEVGCR